MSRALEDSAEYQRRKMMPQTEKDRQAIDLVAHNLKEHKERMHGVAPSFEQCRKEILDIANRVDKERK